MLCFFIKSVCSALAKLHETPERRQQILQRDQLPTEHTSMALWSPLLLTSRRQLEIAFWFNFLAPPWHYCNFQGCNVHLQWEYKGKRTRKNHIGIKCPDAAGGIYAWNVCIPCMKPVLMNIWRASLFALQCQSRPHWSSFVCLLMCLSMQSWISVIIIAHKTKPMVYSVHELEDYEGKYKGKFSRAVIPKPMGHEPTSSELWST